MDPASRKVSPSKGSQQKRDVVNEGSSGGNKDEFDISDSDDGGFARKVVSAVKKPAPKKLAKKEDLFAGMMARGGDQPKKAAAKKLPAPKKTAAKKKKIESGSEDELPAKKSKPGGRKVASDSSDFEDVPPAPREKAGGMCCIFHLLQCF